MNKPVLVELTDGLDDATNVSVSIPCSVLNQLVAGGTWLARSGRDAEVSISGQDQEVGKVTINLFEG
ncbi:hypothetical protein [Streptomyces sp. NPDC047009]|uniref:hypothetical protein n=1 Tax=Streptomyces sp. NPDC047009 TaxID=3154496 RepID=UPI0033C452A1